MNYRRLLLLLLLFAATATAAAATATTTQPPVPSFQEAPSFRNAPSCRPNDTVHIAMTLDPSSLYLRGTFAAVLSLLRHSSCPDNLQFHFLLLPNKNRNPIRLRLLLSTFPSLRFHLLTFDPSRILPVISSSLRPALDNPLNYARFYLADLLPPDVLRVIYLDSDLLVLDDIATLWKTPLDPFLLAAPEYCHANFTSYFTREFWSGEYGGRAFAGLPRRPCYFNTGVMVIDVNGWRSGRISSKLERWVKVQKKRRIYELGSLPPMLLVFAGNVKAVEHRWNQHGLGGDNVEGNCRDLHPGPVSLLHWSGKGKPWLRLDAGQPCPMDNLWSKYDLVRRPERPFFVD